MNYLPGLALNYNPPISASQVTSITGVSHQLLTILVLFSLDGLGFEPLLQSSAILIKLTCVRDCYYLVSHIRKLRLREI
jgi:hypothetical protein